jgi:hypothetical protein
MGRPKKKPETVSGYFRAVFKEKPEWLGEKSNDAMLARYREDHDMAPDAPIATNIKANLANLKSVLRKKRRRRGRPKKAVAVVAMSAVGSVGSAPPRKAPLAKLEGLEEKIDDCLTMARTLDPEGLHEVIVRLRAARNAVVWIIGQ